MYISKGKTTMALDKLSIRTIRNYGLPTISSERRCFPEISWGKSQHEESARNTNKTVTMLPIIFSLHTGLHVNAH